MIDENFPTNSEVITSNVERYIKNAILKKGVDGLPIPTSRIEVLLWELCTQLSQSGGNQGPAGKSAYQLAVESGFEGTQEEWLNSLKGPQGPAGKTGATGPQGSAGKNGTTPVKGVDYWTASDIEEIHTYIDNKIAEGLTPASKGEQNN